MGRVTLKLKKPVALGEKGEPVTELHFRGEVVAGDFRGLKLVSLMDLSTDDMLTIAGRLSGQPDALLNKLSLVDFAEVVKVVLPLLGPGPETGSGPSE